MFSDEVYDQASLDLDVQWGVRRQRWHLVDLDQVWRVLVINHDIEAQNLKTQTVLNIVRLATVVVVLHHWLRQAQSLQYDVVYLFLDELHRFFALLKVDGVKHTLERPLATDIVVVLVLVLLIQNVVLVDGHVGQVHAEVVYVLLMWLLVRNGRETSEAILVDVDAWWIHADHRGIHSQIVLEAVDKVWLVDVALDNHALIRLNHRSVTRQKDASSLALVRRLHDECSLILVLLLAHVLSEVFEVVWHHVRLREEVILCWHEALHHVESATQHVFLCDDEHAGEVIDALVKLHIL